MRTMGFTERWIALIMTFVNSVIFGFGQCTTFWEDYPSRRLRQGDPLSPYLFLIVAEGLSSLLGKVELDQRISGVPIAAGGSRLSHLFFADDSLLFCRANFTRWGNRFQVMHIYGKALSQQLNAAKTSIFFSKNTRLEFRSFIHSSTGISGITGFERYLGLPALVGLSKT
jgi:hypothetical protein